MMLCYKDNQHPIYIQKRMRKHLKMQLIVISARNLWIGMMKRITLYVTMIIPNLKIITEEQLTDPVISITLKEGKKFS